jgi:hypothetical protein
MTIKARRGADISSVQVAGSDTTRKTGYCRWDFMLRDIGR